MKKEIKKITNEDLAKAISSLGKNLGSKIGKLERYTKQGFESLDKKIDLVEENLTKDIKNAEKELAGVKNQLEGTNKRIDDYADTKTSKIEHKKLVSRVDFIEEKLEIAR